MWLLLGLITVGNRMNFCDWQLFLEYWREMEWFPGRTDWLEHRVPGRITVSQQTKLISGYHRRTIALPSREMAGGCRAFSSAENDPRLWPSLPVGLYSHQGSPSSQKPFPCLQLQKSLSLSSDSHKIRDSLLSQPYWRFFSNLVSQVQPQLSVPVKLRHQLTHQVMCHQWHRLWGPRPHRSSRAWLLRVWSACVTSNMSIPRSLLEMQILGTTP